MAEFELTAAAASAASEKRRERRKQRILNSSKERFEKLSLGVGHFTESTNSTVSDKGIRHLDKNVHFSCGQFPKEEQTNDQSNPNMDFQPDSSLDSRLHDSSLLRNRTSNNQSFQSLGDYPPNETNFLSDPLNSQSEEDHLDQKFTLFRIILISFLGVIVRLSLMTLAGKQFIQSIVNPFVAAEITLIGLQKAASIPFNENVGSGLFFMALSLSGIHSSTLNFFKKAFVSLTACTVDFAFYFFTFVCTHIIVD